MLFWCKKENSWLSPPWRALEATDLTALSGQVPDFAIPRSTNKNLCFFFFRKRRVLFFSEEKNQKTFNS
jgi:hypothetical protein